MNDTAGSAALASTHKQHSRLLTLLVLIAAASGGCTKTEEQRASERLEPPATAEALGTVELCGDASDTEAHLQKLFAKGGLQAIHDWVQQSVTLPSNIKLCFAGKTEVVPRVMSIYVQDVNAESSRLRVGPPHENLPGGFAWHTINGYTKLSPTPGVSEGGGIALLYYPPAP